MDGSVSPSYLQRQIIVADTFWKRFLGLFRVKQEDALLLLVRCCDVHTFFMSRPIDLAFIDKNGIVVETCRNVAPGRRIRNCDAFVVAERFSKSSEPWLIQGETVSLPARKARSRRSMWQ